MFFNEKIVMEELIMEIFKKSKRPVITIVVAMNHERVIGINNKLPWHIPEDLQHFKKLTIGKPIIMGRKTFESIGQVLPERKNIILSKNKSWIHKDVYVYTSLEEAIQDNSDFEELCIIGGGEIFKQSISCCDKMHVTVIDLEVKDEAILFPEFDLNDWKLVAQKQIVSSNNINCTFNEYIRY